MRKKYVETDEGIHLMSPIDDEFTLCGIAFDASISENDNTLEFRKASSHIINCRGCIAIIKACKNTRIKE